MSPRSRRNYSIGTSSQADMKLLGIFMTVVESGGLTQAHHTLDIALSSISTYLNDLETRLGLKLCNRGRSGFSLTQDGHAVYQHACRLFSAVDTFHAKVAHLRGKLEGELNIGILDNSTMTPSSRVPEVIHQFSEQHPQVHIHMQVRSSEEIEQLLIDGQIDLGIGLFNHPTPNLKALLQFDVDVDLYCGQDNPLFNKKTIRLADLRHTGYAGGCYAPNSKHPVYQHLPNAGASSFLAEGLAFLILSGRYVGYLPRRYSANWVSNGEMRALPEKRFSHTVQLSLMVSRRDDLSPLAEHFIDSFSAFT